MFTICLPAAAGCYGPDAVYLDPLLWGWASTVDGDCFATIYPDLTWVNPCAETYAISYIYEVYYDPDTTPTLVYTSGPFSDTLPPGTTVRSFVDNIGPVPVAVVNTLRYAEVHLIVTWPDSSVRTYLSEWIAVAYCT